jgi:hypothetical protein
MLCLITLFISLFEFCCKAREEEAYTLFVRNSQSSNKEIAVRSSRESEWDQQATKDLLYSISFAVDLSHYYWSSDRVKFAENSNGLSILSKYILYVLHFETGTRVLSLQITFSLYGSVTFLTSIMQVSSPNFWSNIGYPDWKLSLFSLIAAKKYYYRAFNYHMTAFFTPIQSHYSLIIWCDITGTEIRKE